MQTSQRLLVTGAGGFLGAHVVEQALAAGWKVIAHVRDPAANAPWLEAVERTTCDLARTDSIAAWIDALAPGVVVHTAARSRAADCERDPDLAQLVNVGATRELALASARRGVRLVHVSTDLVFGAVAAPAGGFSERDEPAPISRYGLSKLEGERALLREDPRALVVRLPLLLGPSHGRGLGASDSLLAAIGRGERQALFEDEWRTPLDVRSAALALLELARADVAGPLHVAGPERMSRYELGLRVLRKSGLRADQARAALRATTRAAQGLADSRPADVSLDASRARGSLRTLLVGIDSGSR